MKPFLLVTIFVIVVSSGTANYLKAPKKIDKKDDFQQCTAKQSTVFDNINSTHKQKVTIKV